MSTSPIPTPPDRRADGTDGTEDLNGSIMDLPHPG